VSGRIAIHLDRGLGWTKPVFVAGCGHCGTELARSTDQAAAARAAGRRRCPTCGSRTARWLPGTTSPATDLAQVTAQRTGLGRRPPHDQPLRLRQGGMPASTPASHSPARSPGRSPGMAHRALWQIDMGDGTWAVCCMACRIALYRGPKAGADRASPRQRC
jgi:hypothetical protein